MPDPTPEEDPLQAEGKVVSAGPGRHESVVDVSRAVLLDHTLALVVEPWRGGERGDPVLAVELQGRINRSQDRACIVFVMNAEGAAALAAEVVNLAVRLGPAFAERFIQRVGDHRRDVVAGRVPTIADPGGEQEAPDA